MANATRQRGTVAVGKPITEDNKIPVTTKNLRKKKVNTARSDNDKKIKKLTG